MKLSNILILLGEEECCEVKQSKAAAGIVREACREG